MTGTERATIADDLYFEILKSERLRLRVLMMLEQLGGFYLLDVPDLDAALSWAARCPGASRGSIEVRPVWTM